VREAAARAFVAVGSNIEPARNVREALRLLASRVRVAGVSTVYRTKPLGRPEQEDYYNCVVEVETDAPPLALRSGTLRKIEEALGRERTGNKWVPRTIDLDLIAYEGVEMKTENLTLPDPETWHRPFLALPLAELAPELILTGETRAKTVAQALDGSEMTPLIEYTERLRRDMRHEHPEG
jgi:dihydroneopterin aldolase/2-amino-4-hydroxy-6-hydroxymethyldihydropteridine diphosphokinase